MNSSYVRLSGGLGNQMFQYAFYLSLLEKGVKAAVDVSWYDHYEAHNGFELKKVFNITFNEAPFDEVRKFTGASYSLLGRVIRKFNLSPNIHKQGILDGIRYDANLYNYNKGLYIGYYQSEKYFVTISDEIKKVFSFDGIVLTPQNKAFIEKVENEDSVSIHIRRGDYVNNPLYSNVCDLEYYNNAIFYIRSKIKKPRFYIFSNDVDWCKENIKEDVEYICWNNGENSYCDMILMSRCKHHVIANSSFSWWGAWLSPYENSINIAPRHWFNINSCEEFDVVPKSWIKL